MLPSLHSIGFSRSVLRCASTSHATKARWNSPKPPRWPRINSSLYGEKELIRTQNRCVTPRLFSTSLQTIQTRTFSQSHMYTSVKQLRDGLLKAYGDKEIERVAEWADLSNPSQATLSSILGDSPALQTASPKPPVLILPPQDCQEYEECRVMLQNTASSAAETVFASRDRNALQKLALASIAASDFKFLWKLLNYINKDRWHLFTPESYKLIAHALLNLDQTSKTPTTTLFALFSRHIRAHPTFHSQDMQLLSLSIIVALAKAQPIRALRLYADIFKNRSNLPTDSFDVALLELQLASYLPYPELLYKHAERSRVLANELQDVDAKRKAANAIFFSLVQGLLTSGHTEEAATMLTSVPMAALVDDESINLFVGAYKSVVEAFALKSVHAVEKALGMIAYFPEKMANMIARHERFEWMLLANANCEGKERMDDAAAGATLECMSLVSGVTPRALNAYLGIIALNSSPSASSYQILKSHIDMLGEKFGFLGDAETARLLCMHASSPSQVIDEFYRACRSGYADANVYAMMFRKVFGEAHTDATNLSEFRLAGLLEQFERSQLSWTPTLLFAVLSALSKHKMWKESWDLFSKLAATGEVVIESKSANLAMASAQRLGGNHASLAGKLAKDMEMNLIRAQPSRPMTKPALTAAISSRNFDALNAPNSALAKTITDTLISRKEDMSIELIANAQPWMILDPKTFNLICVQAGYQADLYLRLTSEPFNLVPTSQTYLLMIRSCLSHGSWDELVKLLVAMVEKHPMAVTDETIDDVLVALMNASQAHLLLPLRNALKRHGKNLPEAEELVKRFGAPRQATQRRDGFASSSL